MESKKYFMIVSVLESHKPDLIEWVETIKGCPSAVLNHAQAYLDEAGENTASVVQDEVPHKGQTRKCYTIEGSRERVITLFPVFPD